MREEDGHCGSALLPLWPTAIGYAVSYLFIAIIWTNHYLMGLRMSLQHACGDEFAVDNLHQRH